MSKQESPCHNCLCSICAIPDSECNRCDGFCQATKEPIKDCPEYQQQEDEYDGAEYGH
jgi:hypothetical protein